MKRVTTFKFLSLLCFAILSQMSFAQISCLPQGVALTASVEFCDYPVQGGDVLTPASFALYGNDGVSITLWEDEEMTTLAQPDSFLRSTNLNTAVYVSATNDDGQSCWTTVILEDKDGPLLDCPCEDPTDPGCTYSCSQLDSLLNGDLAGALPVVFEACSAYDSTVVDQFIDADCTTDTLRRTFTATDAAGNESVCTYDILIEPIDPMDIEFPEDDTLFCNIPFSTDAEGAPSPEVTGYPTVNGTPFTGGGLCDYFASYEDQISTAGCNGKTVYLRTWTFITWCADFDVPGPETQIIKVLDETGPVISGVPTTTVELGTSSSDCSASYVLPGLSAEDTCDDGDIDVEIVSISGGTLNNAGTAIFGLPLGLSTITVSATDDCGNTTTASFDVNVTDNVPPVMSCETFRTVSLTIDEPSLVDAIAFDDGSEDNCGIVEFDVRRMDNPSCLGFDGTPYGPKAPFYCCDIGGPNVMVELRARDEAGNTNSCMVEVEVQDKLNPAITCPPNKTLDCFEDFNDLTVTGEATAVDNCSAVVTFLDNGDVDNCGEGTIFRIWTATDPGGRTASCVQRIDLINSSPFFICDTEAWNTPILGCDVHTLTDGVEWPADIELDGCGFGLEPEDLEGVVNINNVRPRIFEDECDLVGVTKSDIDLPITDNACRKILRVWKVYDWCTFDEDEFDPNDPIGTPGYYEYNQIIKVIDSDAPVVPNPGNQSFCSYDPFCGGVDVDLSIQATDACTTDDDDLNYSYEIDAFNDGSIQTSLGGTGKTVNPNQVFPIGTHRIIWTVEDGCGNLTSIEYLFVISDCKLPSPYAHSNLIVEMMPVANMISIWAIDLDAGSFDNCGVAEILIAKGFEEPGTTAPNTTNPSADDYASAGVTFTCADDEVGPQFVTLWVRDVNGLWDFVNTQVIVQDNQVTCGDDASVAGVIENEEASEVEDVVVEIQGDGMFNTVTTDVNGTYAFVGLPFGNNYTVTPERDDNPLNGVTTFDLVLMSKHILGIQNLDSPYKMIAADINKSGTITTFDMVQLRKLILFIDTEFQSNTSWRFVDADYVFPDATNPFAASFPEIFNINSLAGDEIGDFVAVKVGDVNCSAQVNGIAGSSDDRSANGEVVFGVKDQALVAGETYTVDFNAADFAEVLGYQFSLAFDKNAVEFVDVETSLEGLTADNFGMSLINEGVITTSWNSINAVSLDADAKVFSLTFVAKSNAQLSEVLAVNSRYTKAEAYDSNVNLMNIGLSFNGTTASAEFELYQNQPNPFKAETMIGFNLPEAGFASLTVFDVAGKVLHRVEGDFAKGFNQVTLNRSDLTATGVVYYQLETENESATKKMIIIK